MLSHAIEHQPRQMNVRANQMPPTTARLDEEIQEFRQWFGKSKVVDDQGQPMMLYHGTIEDFEQFEHQHRRPDLGFHFGTSEQANHFAKTRGGRLLPVYLRMENPLRLNDTFGKGPIAVGRVVLQLESLKVITPEQGQKIQMIRPLRNAVAAIRKVIEVSGYDGVVYENRFEGLRTLRPDEIVDVRVRPNKGPMHDMTGTDKAFVASLGESDWPIGMGPTEDAALGKAYAHLFKTPSFGVDSYIAFHADQVRFALPNRLLALECKPTHNQTQEHDTPRRRPRM